MDNKESSKSKKDKSTLVGPGAVLRMAREELQLSPMDIANKLRLRSTIIEDLENDNYTQVKRHVFIRGYLRAYAKVVNVSPDKIVSAFNDLGIPEESASKFTWQIVSETTQAKSHSIRWVPYFAVMFIVIIAAIGWFSHQSSITAEEDNQLFPVAQPPNSLGLRELKRPEMKPAIESEKVNQLKDKIKTQNKKLKTSRKE
jgi:cytoskeleton protein RodZ